MRKMNRIESKEMMEVEGFGYCGLHEKPIEEDQYEWKGCWGCYHFIQGRGFPYLSVSYVSEKLGVSESTVRGWIKKGLLRGKIFEQGRYTGSTPAPRKYHIEKESFEELKKSKAKA
jgi:hypothetical protein